MDQIVKLWLLLKISMMMEVKIVFSQNKIIEMTMVLKSTRRRVFIL